jgi:uncharacterized protein
VGVLSDSILFLLLFSFGLHSCTNTYIYFLKQIDILVNNAGIGAAGTFMESSADDINDVIDLNAKSVVSLTHLLIPYMTRRSGTDRPGARLLVIGSIAGCAPGPNAAVYSASKAFVSSFTLALRRELMCQGVMVSLAMPGPGTLKSYHIPPTPYF